MGTYGDNQSEPFLEESAVRMCSDPAGRDIRLLVLEPLASCFPSTRWPFPTCKHNSTVPGVQTRGTARLLWHGQAPGVCG